MTEVPGAPFFYRISGDSISLLEAISQVCQDGGCDYYINLEFVRHQGEILKIIKVKTISRRFQPTLGRIQEFIDDVEEVVSSDIGRELRNEVNSAVLIGGDIEFIQETIENAAINENANIWPYWGLNSNNQPIIGIGLGNDHQFTVETAYLNIFEIGNFYLITVLELRAALAGQNAWETYMAFAKPGIAASLNISKVWAAAKLVNIIDNTNQLFGSDFRDSTNTSIQRISDRKNDEILLDKVKTLFSFVKAYATEFYGKKFLVRLPFVCSTRDIESGEVTHSVSVNDSAWIDDTFGVIGLQNQALLDIFRDEQGKLSAFVKFSNANTIDLSRLSPDDVVYEQNELFVRVSVGDKVVFDNPINFTGPRAVVTLPGVFTVKKFTGDRPAIYEFLVNIINAENITSLTNAQWDTLLSNVGELDAQAGLGPLPFRPTAAATPFKSNIGSYGPWFVSGANGKVQFERDESLVPWNFGGTALMSVAGSDKAARMLTFMQEAELGSIEVPGTPELALGAELRSNVTNLFETRLVQQLPLSFGLLTIFIIRIPSQPWEGTFGPNVSNMDVTIDVQNGLTTNYRMQTFTPKYIGVFGKNNAEVLKTLGQRQQKLRRSIRTLGRPKIPEEIGSKLDDSFFGGYGGRDGVGGSKNNTSILVGQTIDFNSGTEKRNAVKSQGLEESKTELGRNYANKAWMSMDGLLRPFSTAQGNNNPTGFSGIGGAPCKFRNSVSIFPPFSGFPDLAATYINLNPLLSPGEGLGTHTGHDIEYIVHGNSLINDVHIRLTSNYAAAESTSYRGLCLRGPLIMTGWGLDIHGKPVPNSLPSTPADTFENDWLKKSGNWKTGPVDLRWDDNRGVWTGWPGYKIVTIEFDTALTANSTAAATVLDSAVQYDANGVLLSKDILVTSPIDGQSASVGDQAFAYYDTNTCKYWPLLGGGGADVIEGILLDGMSPGDLCHGVGATLTVYGVDATGCVDFSSDCRGDIFSEETSLGPIGAETVVNRDVTLQADDNAYCIAIFMNGEFRPVYVGCPPCPTSGCVDAPAPVSLIGESQATTTLFGNLTVSVAPS